MEFVPGGSNEACINISITDDNVNEETEDFTVDLEPSNSEVQEGDPNLSTVNIFDNDGKTIIDCILLIHKDFVHNTTCQVTLYILCCYGEEWSE